MADQGSGDFRRGRDREEEESRRRSGREGGYFGPQGGYSSGREGYSEPLRSEYGGGYEEGGQQTLYGQGRRSQEPWRPGQSGYSEGGSPYGGGYQERQPGPTSYRRSTGYQGYGSPDSSAQGWGYSGSRSIGAQSGSYGFGTQEFGTGREGYTGRAGFGSGGGGFGSPGYGGMTGRGRFSGKGPKGYTRSDDRIKEDVSDRLEQHGEIDASEIEVRVQSGEVTLEGTVEDRWTKRLAEDTVEDCPGVKEVHNRLRVQSQGEAGRSQSQSEKLSFGGSTARTQGTSGTQRGSMRGTEGSRGSSSTTRSSTRT